MDVLMPATVGTLVSTTSVAVAGAVSLGLVIAWVVQLID